MKIVIEFHCKAFGEVLLVLDQWLYRGATYACQHDVVLKRVNFYITGKRSNLEGKSLNFFIKIVRKDQDATIDEIRTGLSLNSNEPA